LVRIENILAIDAHRTYICPSKTKTMKFTLLVFLLSFSLIAQSQSPTLVWNKTYGGSQAELVGAFATTSLFFGRWAAVDADENDQVYVATTSTSNDHDVSTNHGDEDVWVLSLNQNGDTLWTQVLGGSQSERVLKVRARTGGGCYVVGHSRSSNGSFTQNHTSNSYADGFVAAFSPNGTLSWMKLYGGSSDDFLHDIIETNDGHLMACGETISSDGDLNNTGNGMNWVLKINANDGAVIWSKTYIGPDGQSNDRLENVFRLTQLTDNDIVLTGYTTPDFNDFNLDRVHVMKINLAGDLLWTKKIGASGGGDYPCAILPAENGSFYILAKIVAAVGGSGDAANYYGGGGDFWLVKLDAVGDITFEKNYGGSNLDVPYDMLFAADGSLYLAGMSRSNDFDADSETFGLADFWMIKVNASNGAVVYKERFGGSSNDFCSGIALTQNGNSIFMVGGTDSDDGIVSNFKGVRDLWVLRLMYDTQLGLEPNQQAIPLVYPNPSASQIYFANSENTLYDVSIIDLNGRVLFKKAMTNQLDLENFSDGVYLLRITDINTGIETVQRLMIQK